MFEHPCRLSPLWLVCFLRPFLAPLWAAAAKCDVVSNHDESSASVASGMGAKRRRLPEHMLSTKQFSHALVWLLACFSYTVGPLERSFPLYQCPFSEWLCIATDASPWGIGGVLLCEGIPVAWFADELHRSDLRRFNAKRGTSDFNTLWEALAILVAVRLAFSHALFCLYRSTVRLPRRIEDA